MGGGGLWGLRCTVYTLSPNKLWRSTCNFIFNLCCTYSVLPLFHLQFLSLYTELVLYFTEKPIFVTVFADLRRSSWWWWACPRRASPCPPPGWSPAPSPPSSGSPWWARRAARQRTSGLKQDRLFKGSISRDNFGLFLHAGITLARVWATLSRYFRCFYNLNKNTARHVNKLQV